MLSELQFIKDNWVKIALTWNDRDNNLPYLDWKSTEMIKSLNEEILPKGAFW